VIVAYAGSRSIPRKRNPSAAQATPVVPDPANGSRTNPPGGVTMRTRWRIRSVGLTVTCSLVTGSPVTDDDRSLRLAFGMRK
jgi:hypothetical protein